MGAYGLPMSAFSPASLRTNTNSLTCQAIISFIGDKSQPDYYGYLLLVGMFCGNYVGTICEAQYFQIISRAGMHIRCALVHVLFRKATSISNQSLKEVYAGSGLAYASNLFLCFTYISVLLCVARLSFTCLHFFACL